MKAIEIKNLNFSYGDKKILKNINLSVDKGKKVFILGGNGEGKTTLLQHLNGLLRSEKGNIKIQGEYLKKDKIDEIRKEVGFLFQNPDNQIIAPIVSQDVGIGPCNLNLSEEEVRKRTEHSLKKVGIFDLKDRKTHDLSIGERKKVAIAGVLALKPSILVLDEPASSLDPKSSKEFMDLIEKLCNDGKTIIAATHKIDLAYETADRVVLMKEGEIIQKGKPEDVLINKDLLEKCRLTFPKKIIN